MQRNTQLVLLAVILVAGILLGRTFLQQEEHGPVSSVSTEDQTLPGNPAIPTLAIVEQRPTGSFVEQKVEQKTEGPVNLWTTGSNNPVLDIPGAQSDIAGAVQIQFDTQALRNLQRGDDLSIEVPQSATNYRVNVEKVVQHPGGITEIQARQSDDVRLVMTLGQKNTFANLATLNGNYELVGNTTTGWLMPAENMDPDMDPSIPDFVALPKIHVQAREQSREDRQILN